MKKVIIYTIVVIFFAVSFLLAGKYWHDYVKAKFNVVSNKIEKSSETLKKEMPKIEQTLKKEMSKLRRDIKKQWEKNAMTFQGIKAATPPPPVESKLNSRRIQALLLQLQNTKKRVLPASSKPTELRPLPFPFYNYFSIASDVDSMTWDQAAAIHEFINRELKLNLSDSAFIDAWPAFTGDALDENLVHQETVMINTVDPRLFYRFIKWYNYGWFDTIHGWSPCTIFYHSTSPVSLEFEAVDGKQPMEKTIILSLLTGHTALSTGQVARNMLFRYKKPNHGRFSISILDERGKPIWTAGPEGSSLDGAIAGFKQPGRSTFTNMGISLDKVPLHILGQKQIKIRIRFHPLYKGDRLVIRELSLANRTPERARELITKLERFNIFLPVWTTHCYPISGILGAETLVLNPEKYPHRQWMSCFLGDAPTSMFYWIDQLADYGVEFILTANNTSKARKVWPIDQLASPFLFNDSVWRWSFNRFAYPYKSRPVSLEREMGLAIKLGLGLLSTEGQGALLYTHWGAGHNPDQSQDIGHPYLAKESRAALLRLAERFYGWDNNGPVPLGLRLWVPGTHQLLVYSRMIQQAKDNVFYDSVSNSVHIFRWVDPVSGRVFPDYDFPAKDLQGLTVYVRDSATCRLFLDGVEIKSFKRNLPDLTGKVSITVVDSSFPTIVFDEVDFYQQFGRLRTKGAYYFLRKTGGPSGRRMIEVKIDENEGRISWAPNHLDTSLATHFRFSYRKADPSTKIGIRIIMEDGSEHLAAEKGLWNSKASGWCLPMWKKKEWRDITVDFCDEDMTAAGKITLPRGKVNKVLFLVKGKKGATVWFDRVEFLHQNALPNPPDGCLVAGRLEIPAGTKKLKKPKKPKKLKVVMVYEGKKFSCLADQYGIFYFKEKVPRDKVIMVYAAGSNNDRYFPLRGRMLQVKGNMVDLTIPLKDPRSADLNGSVPERLTKAKSDFIKGVGKRYLPHGTYETTGISKPSEYHFTHKINNIGFLDRERVFKNIDKARRILLFGTCMTFGHTSENNYRVASILEGILEQRTGQDFEVINLTSTLQRFGTDWFYYENIGKKFKPEIVVMDFGGGNYVGFADPVTFGAYQLFDPDHLPRPFLRLGEDGQLTVQPADPNFLKHRITDPEKIAQRERDKKKHVYVVNGFDLRYGFHQEPSQPLPPMGKRLVKYFKSLLELYKKTYSRDSAKFMVTMTDLYSNKPPWTENGLDFHHKYYYQRWAKLCHAHEVPFLNTKPYFDKHKNKRQKSWRRDSHYSRVGYRWYAEAVAEYLLKTNFLKNIPEIHSAPESG